MERPVSRERNSLPEAGVSSEQILLILANHVYLRQPHFSKLFAAINIHDAHSNLHEHL